VLRIVRSAHDAMIDHAVRGLPNEACGLLGARWGSDLVEAFVPVRNADASTKTYSIGPDGFAEADRVLLPLGLDVIGVMHSHTHTDPYPSPTDVAAADNPLLEGWHYVIVSLRDTAPMLRSWILDDRTIVETPVAIVADPAPATGAGNDEGPA
jgi:proteasome lid subunit RPN8/RPN11